jgi:hypothetical protein
MCYCYAKRVRALSGGEASHGPLRWTWASGVLSCASGAASLEAVVSYVLGIKHVTVDLAMERVSVTFGTDATGVQAIAKTISARLVQGDRHDGMRD